jgi:hypothetical protein
MTTLPQADDLALLEALIVDNPDLERLEALLEQFNIFEALGAVRVELRHSDFLAFLLNPNQSHGLGDVFVKRLLQKALASSQNASPITPIDLDLYDLRECYICHCLYNCLFAIILQFGLHNLKLWPLERGEM